MKKWMIPLLAVCSLALLGGCGKKTEAVNTETTTIVTAAETNAAETTAETADTVTEAGNESLIGMANPWTDHENLDEAENAAGFHFALPETPGYTASVWRTLGDNMIEGIFTDANGEEAYRIRKGRGQEDVSGDYNTYPIVNDLNIDGIDIDMREDEDGVHRITFHSNEFAYAFTSGTYVPAEDEAEVIVSEIISFNDDFKAAAEFTIPE